MRTCFIFISDIRIIKHPYVSGKVAPGMSLCLGCEAVSSKSSVNYQWFKNRRPLPGKFFFFFLYYNRK